MTNESLFDYLEGDDSQRRKEQRTATRVANKRVNDQYAEFLNGADDFTDHQARLDLVSDDIKETISEVVSEYGGDPESIEASILRNLSGIEKLAPGKEHMPGVGDKRNRQYEHIKEQLLESGKSEERAKEEAARTVNKQRAEHGETKSSSVVESRKPKLCPYHSEVVDISLASGDPRAGFDAMAQHAWGANHCQGEGFEGRCNFKRDMVTQSYWDEKKQQAEDRRQQRELEREQLLEQAPQAPEGDIGDAPEPDLVDEPKDINEELAEAPSAVGEGDDDQARADDNGMMQPAMAKAQDLKRQAEADRDGGGAVETVEVDKGSADDPSPEMDKTRWNTDLKPVDTEMSGSPKPTKEKDILDPIVPKTDDSFLDEADSVTEKQELPSAGEDGDTTDKNTETIHTDTWSGNNGASPVTRETQSSHTKLTGPYGLDPNDPGIDSGPPGAGEGSSMEDLGYSPDEYAGKKNWRVLLVRDNPYVEQEVTVDAATPDEANQLAQKQYGEYGQVIPEETYVLDSYDTGEEGGLPRGAASIDEGGTGALGWEGQSGPYGRPPHDPMGLGIDHPDAEPPPEDDPLATVQQILADPNLDNPRKVQAIQQALADQQSQQQAEQELPPPDEGQAPPSDEDLGRYQDVPPLDSPGMPGFRGATDPDKNPIRQILEDGFVPQSQAESAISEFEDQF